MELTFEDSDINKFHSTFTKFGQGQEIVPATFKPHFLNFDPFEWDQQGGGGSLQYTAQDGVRYSLTCIANKKYGVMLQWDCLETKLIGINNQSFSIGNKERMHQIEDIGDEEFYPVGSFLKPELAWLAVRDFFSNPSKKSNQIEWINSNDIEWPDDF